MVKGSIILSGFLLAFTALGFPIIGVWLGYDFEAIEKNWIVLWVLTFISGAIMVFLLSSVKLLEKNTPEKIPLSFETYELLKNFLNQTLEEYGFEARQTYLISPFEEVRVYIKSPKLGMTDCLSLIRVPELSEENLSMANEKITETLKLHYNEKIIFNNINMISVFCVDRITPAFRKLLNSTVCQGLKNGRLVVGISFGGKNIYISRPNDGFAIVRYKKLRNFFLEVMNFKNSTEDGLRKT